MSCKTVVKDLIQREGLLDLPIILSLTSLDAVCHYFIGTIDQVQQLKLQNPTPDCQVGKYVTNQSFLIANDKLATIFDLKLLEEGSDLGEYTSRVNVTALW